MKGLLNRVFGPSYTPYRYLKDETILDPIMRTEEDFQYSHGLGIRDPMDVKHVPHPSREGLVRIK